MIFYCMKLSLLTGKSKLQKRKITFVLNKIFYPGVKKKKKVTFLNSTVFGDNFGANIRNKNMIFCCMRLIQKDIFEKIVKK